MGYFVLSQPLLRAFRVAARAAGHPNGLSSGRLSRAQRLQWSLASACTRISRQARVGCAGPTGCRRTL